MSRSLMRALTWLPLALGVFCNTLVVVPWLAGGTELYTTPKLAALVLGALLAACSLLGRRGSAEVRWLDIAWGSHLAFGLASAAINGPIWSVPATWFLPLAAATLLASGCAFDREQDRSRVLELLVLSALAVALIALLEACDVSLPWRGMRRPHSTLGNRNFVAAEVAVGLVIALSTLRRRPHVLRLASIALLATVVTLTRCRGVWLGLACAVLVGAALGLGQARLRRSLALGLGAAAIGGAAGVLVPFPGLHWRDGGVSASANRVLEVSQGSGRGRLEDYALAAAMLRQRPSLGFGPRRWEDASSAVAHEVPERHASAYTFWATPNSDLARIAGEQGLFGIATLAAALVAVAHAGVRTLRRSRVSAKTASEGNGEQIEASAQGTVAALLGLFVYAVNGLLDAPLFRPSSLAVIACLCALLRGGSPAVARIPMPTAAKLALASGFMLAALTSLRVTAAVVLRHGRGSIDARSAAQQLWPRPGVAESLVVSLAQQGRCADAEARALDAMSWSPHHWAAPYFVALCRKRSGERGRADELRRQALAIEPHLDELIARRRQGSGDLRLDGQRESALAEASPTQVP